MRQFFVVNSIKRGRIACSSQLFRLTNYILHRPTRTSDAWHKNILSKTTRRQEADGAASKQEVSKPSGLRIGPRGRRHDVGGQIGVGFSLTKGFTTTAQGWPWIKGSRGIPWPGRVEECQTHSPLIKPCMRFSRTRLSDILLPAAFR